MIEDVSYKRYAFSIIYRTDCVDQQQTMNAITIAYYIIYIILYPLYLVIYKICNMGFLNDKHADEHSTTVYVFWHFYEA